MKYNLYILILSIFISMVSCESKKNEKNNQMYLPAASSTIGEILVVVDTAKWNTTLGTSIKSIFLAPEEGLPQDEPRFKANRVNYEQYSSILRKISNVMIVFTFDMSEEKISKLKLLLGENNYEKLRQNSSKFIYIQEDVFAKGQNMMFVFAENEKELITKLNEKSNFILSYFNQKEIEKYQVKLYKNGERKLLEKTFNKKYGFQLKIPEHFQIAMDTTNVVWLRKPIEQVDYNIIVASVPYVSNNQMEFEKINQWRDYIGKTYIFGNSDTNSYKVTEKLIPVTNQNFTYKGKYMVWSKGLWKLKNNSMGGPFVSMVLLNEEEDTLFYIEGFVFAPGKPKRELIREIESIIKTFDI